MRDEYSKALLRLRVAMDQWLAGIEDWSDEPEELMLARLDIGARPETTQPPIIERVDSSLHLSSETKGASIGFRVDEGPWKIYQYQPIVLGPGETLEAKAVRYGFEESVVVQYPNH